MTRPLRLLVPLVAAALAFSGCTTAWPHWSYHHGDIVRRTYTCNWKSNSWYLKPGCEPNSPILPYMRGSCESPRNFVGAVFILPLALDLVGSPLAYYFDRDCSESGVSYSHVGSPAESWRKHKERVAREKAEREYNSAQAVKKRAAEALAAQKAAEAAAKRLAEQKELERLYPALPEAPRAEPQRPDDFALVVGIEDYRGLPKADYAENDALTMKTYLRALGVPAQNIITLTGEKADRSDIAKYLEEWLPANVKPDSRVYFYYSGHGAPDPATGAAYLVPYDGDASFLKSTAYPLSKLYADLGALPNKETVVMLDSCFSGTGGRSVLASGVRPLVLLEDTTQPPEKASVLAASGAREIAGGLDLRRHGLFTYFLLRGMAGEADAAHAGHVTLGDLDKYVAGRVAETAHRANRDQHPRLLGSGALLLY